MPHFSLLYSQKPAIELTIDIELNHAKEINPLNVLFLPIYARDTYNKYLKSHVNI